jgi:GntR family transcriptional regulator
MLALTRASPKPLYRQLQERLRRELELGKRAPHSRLPSEREWVRKLGVSRITVRQALGELVSQGYLYSVPGKGLFVGERRAARELDPFLSFTAATLARGEQPSSRLLEGRLIRAGAELAGALGIDAGDDVVSLHRVRLASGAPVMIQRAYLPHDRCPGLLERPLEQLSLFATLREVYGCCLVRAETRIAARPARRDERELLGLPPRAVVLVTDQLTVGADGLPVERSEAVLHPDRHALLLVQEDRGASFVWGPPTRPGQD